MAIRVWAASLAVGVLLLLPSGCRQTEPDAAREQAAAPPAEWSSSVHVADARTQGQLISGFYDLEGGAWRWAAGKFTVVLKTPSGAAMKGGRLEAKVMIPEVLLAQVKETALTASINGTALPAETFKKAGEYTYARDVPANLLAGENTKIDFAVSRSLPPGADKRELGLIAISFDLK